MSNPEPIGRVDPATVKNALTNLPPDSPLVRLFREMTALDGRKKYDSEEVTRTAVDFYDRWLKLLENTPLQDPENPTAQEVAKFQALLTRNERIALQCALGIHPNPSRRDTLGILAGTTVLALGIGGMAHGANKLSEKKPPVDMDGGNHTTNQVPATSNNSSKKDGLYGAEFLAGVMLTTAGLIAAGSSINDIRKSTSPEYAKVTERTSQLITESDRALRKAIRMQEFLRDDQGNRAMSL